MRDYTKQEGHSILTIPPELCDLIIISVDPPDLISLRQVSREAARRADKPFLENFFSQRAFLLSSDDSLRRLLAITEDDRLVRSMRSLDLCIGETPMWHEWYISTASTSYCQWFRQAFMHFTGPIDRVWAENRLRYREGEEMWDALIEKRRAFSEQGTDRELLTRAFSRLERFRSGPIEIRIVDRRSACEVPYGLARIERLSGERLDDYDHEEKCIPLVLETLERSGLEVDSFAIIFGGSYSNDISKVVGQQRRVDMASTKFRHLKKLHLKFDHGKGTPSDAVIDNFCGFIGSIPEVHDLALNIQFEAGGFWERDSFSRLTNGLCGVLRTKLPALRNLELQNVHVPTETLLETLPHIKSLGTLHYHTWCKNHPPYWEDVSRMPQLAKGNHRNSPEQAEIDSFRASCGCPSLKIATCTLLEWVSGKRC